LFDPTCRNEVHMAPVIVPIYAAILALIYIGLAMRVIRSRRGARIAIGTGGNTELAAPSGCTAISRNTCP
jgi:uncharacterized membrane protein YecN with MAPEG domain